MITNFNEYITEKSFFNNLNLKQDFISKIHKIFHSSLLTDKEEIREINKNDIIRSGKNITKSEYFYLLISNNFYYVIYSNNNFHLYTLTYDINNKELISDITRRSFEYFKIQNYNKIFNDIYENDDILHIYQITGNFRKTVNFNKETEKDKLHNILLQYVDILEKVFLNIYNKLAEFYQTLDTNEDYNIKEKIIADIQHVNLNRYLTRKLLIGYFEINIKKFGINDSYDITYNTLEENDLHNISKKILYGFFKQYVGKLNIKKQEVADKLIEISPELFSDLKNDIFFKELKQKWEHLFNANKFDLI